MHINLIDFYSRLGTIALILALGFYLGKKKFLSTKTNQDIVNLLLTVFMPASLFVAFPSTYDAETSALFFSGLAGGILVMLVMILLSRVIFSKGLYKGEVRFESQFAFIFNNAAFLGYPVISSTFGEAGLAPYCGFIIAFNFALFSYGVYLFKRKFTPKLVADVLKNPNVLAVLIGMVFFMTGLSLPGFVTDAIKFTGNATTPLSIICIGFMLSRADFRQLTKRWRLMLTAAIQLILGPLVTFLLLSFLRFPSEVIAVCTIIQALPTATSLGLFAAKYGGNEIESSELVTISTILSMVTMPIMIGILLVW